ncbi:hypothetical protein BGHDH14_bgh04330 [Blumeria hordei DH14]|uniref:Uncharacterized protein n=1 Tax=Blumeria graminis f. sp. hordei (strain DH14) TaxID=546991 RepID=N1J945_BLUG1|nr:hypothetical protein BGHDH14_bgh04330 [Blumeria hordei DH14]
MSPPNSRPPLTSRIRASFEGRRHKAEVSSPTSSNSYDNKSIRTIVEQVINTQPFQTAVATNLAQLIKPNIKDALDTIQPLVEAVYAHEVLLRKTNFSVENLLTKLETDVLRPKSNSTSIVESDNEEIVLPQILHISKSHSKASGNNSSSINLDKKSFGKTVNANKDAVTDSIEGAQYSTLAAETFVQEIMPIKQQIKDLELNTEHSKCNMGLMEEKLDQIKSDLSIVISMISEEKGGGTTASLDSSKGSRTSLEDHNYAGNRYRDGLSRSSTQGSDSTITMKKKYIKEPKQKFCKDKSHDSNASQEPSVVETRSRSPSDSLHTQTLKKLELEVANLKESFDSKMASNDERISTVLATLENHPQTPSDNYFVKAIEKLNTNQESQYLALCTLLTEGMTLTRNKEFEKLGLKVAQLQDHLKGPDVILEDIRSSNALQKNALVNQTSVLDEIKINMASYDTKLQQHSEAITRLISISSEPLPIVTADKSGLEEHITSLNDTLKSHTSEFVEIKAANAAHAKVLEKNTANLEQIKADIESYMATVQNNIGLFDETTRDTLASTQLTYNNSIALGDQIMSIKANVDSQKSCLDKFKFETEFNYNKKFDLVESQIKDITDSLISHSSFLDQILSKCSAYNTALQTVNDMEEFFKSELHEIKQSNDMNSRTLSSIKSNYENKIDVINQVNAWGVSFNQDMKDIKSLQESYARTSSDNQQKNLDILKRIKDSHELHSDVLSGIKEAIDSSTSDSKIIKAFHKSHEGTILDIKTSIDVTNTNFGVKLGSIESTVFENDKKLELLKRTVQNMKQDITLDFESEKIYKILQMIVESLAAHSVLLGEIKEDVCAEILTSLHDLERVIQSNSNLLADTQHVDVNAEILTLLHTINEDYSSIPLSLSEIKDHCANPNPSSVVIALIQKRFADIEGAMSEHLNHLITLSSFADSSKKREDIKLSKLKEVESFIEQILGTSKESTFKINEIILKLDCQNTAIDRLNQKSYNETSLKILNTLQSTNELSLIKIEENSFNARNINDETRNLYKLIEKIHTFIISAFPEIKSGQEHLENLGEKSRQEAKSELSQISEYLLTLQTILGKASNTIDNTFSEVIKPYHDQDITHHMSVISDSMKNDIQKFGTVVQDFMEKVEENKILLNSMTETLRDIISISLTDNGDGYAPNQGRRQTHQDTSLREEIGFSAETEAFLSQSDSIDSYQVKKKEIIKRNVFSGLNPSSTVNDWQKEALKFPDERKLATICSGDIGNHVLQTDFQIESNFPAQSDLQVESMTQVNENNDFIRKIDSQSQGNNVGHKLTPECIVKDEDCPLKTDLTSQSGDQNKYHLPVEFKERTARNAENANQIQQNIVKPIPDTTRLKFQSECKDETEESNKYLDLPAKAVTPSIDIGHNIQKNDVITNDNFVTAKVTSECQANSDQHIKRSSRGQESAVPGETHFQITSDTIETSDLQNEINASPTDIKDIILNHNFVQHVDKFLLHEPTQCQDNTVEFVENSNPPDIPKLACESNYPIELDTIRELDLPHKISEPIHEVRHVGQNADLIQDHNVECFDEATQFEENSSDFQLKTRLRLKSVIPVICDAIMQSNITTETGVTTINANSIASSDDLIQKYDTVRFDKTQECKHNNADNIEKSIVQKGFDASHDSFNLNEAKVNLKPDLPTEVVPSTINNGEIICSEDMVPDNAEIDLYKTTGYIHEPQNSINKTKPKAEAAASNESMYPDEHNIILKLDDPSTANASAIDVYKIGIREDIIQDNNDVRLSGALECQNSAVQAVEETILPLSSNILNKSTLSDEDDIIRQSDLPVENVQSTIDVEDSIRADDVGDSIEAIVLNCDPIDSIEKSSGRDEPDSVDESVQLDEVDLSYESDLPVENVQSTIDVEDSIRADDVGDSIEAFVLNIDPIDSIEELSGRDEPDSVDESVQLDEVDLSHESDLPVENVQSTIDVEDSNCSDDMNWNHDVEHSDNVSECNDDPAESIKESSALVEPDEFDGSVHLNEVDISHESDLPVENVQSSIDVEDSIRADDVGDSNEAIVLNCDPIDSIEKSSGREEPDSVDESVQLDEVDLSYESDLPVENVQSTIDVEDSIRADDVGDSNEAIVLNCDPIDSIEESTAREEPDSVDESVQLDEVDLSYESDLPVENVQSSIDVEDSIRADDVGDSIEAIVLNCDPIQSIEESTAREEPDSVDESVQLDEVDLSYQSDLPVENVQSSIDVEDSIRADDVGDSIEAIVLNCDPIQSIEESTAREESDSVDESLQLDEVDLSYESDLPVENVQSSIDVEDSIRADDVGDSIEAIVLNCDPIESIEESLSREEHVAFDESVHLDEVDISHESETPIEIAVTTGDVEESNSSDDVGDSIEAFVLNIDPIDSIEELSGREEPDSVDESVQLDEVDLSYESDLPVENVQSSIDVEDSNCSDDMNWNHDVEHSDHASECNDDPAESIKESSARDDHVAFDGSVHLDEVDISHESDTPIEIAVTTGDVEESNSSDDIGDSIEAFVLNYDLIDSIEESSAREEPDSVDESVQLDEVDLSHESDLPVENVQSTIDVEDSIRADDVGDSIEAIVLNCDPIDSIEESSGRDEPDSVDESVHLDEVDLSYESDLPVENVQSSIDVEDSIRADDVGDSNEAIVLNFDPIESIEELSTREEPDSVDESVQLDEVDLSYESDLPVENVQSTIDVEDSIRADDVGDSNEAIVLNCDPIESIEELSTREEPDSVDESVQLDEVDISHESDLPVENVQSSIDVEERICSDDVARAYEAIILNFDPIYSIAESSAKAVSDLIDESEYLTRGDRFEVDAQEMMLKDNPGDDDKIADVSEACVCQDGALKVVEEMNPVFKPENLRETAFPAREDDFCDLDSLKNDIARTHGVESVNSSDNMIDHTAEAPLDKTRQGLDDLADSIREPMLRDESDELYEILNSNKVNVYLEADMPTEIITSTNDADVTLCSYGICQHDDVARKDELRDCEDEVLDIMGESHLHVQSNNLCESELLGENNPDCELLLPAEINGLVFDVDEIVGGDDLTLRVEVIRSDDPTESRYLSADCIEVTKVLDETDVSDEPLHHGKPDVNRETDLPTENIVSITDVDDIFCNDENIQHDEVGSDVALESKDDSEKLNNDVGCSAERDDAMLLVTSVVSMISKPGNEDISVGNKLLGTDDDGSPKVLNKCESDSVNLNPAEILSKHVVPNIEFNRSNMGNDEFSGDIEDLFEDLLSSKDEVMDWNIIGELDDNDEAKKPFESNVVIAHITKVTDFPVESVELSHDNEKILLKNFHRTEVENAETILGKKSLVHAETISDEKIVHTSDVMDADTKTKCLPDVSKTGFSMHKDSIEEIESSIRNSGNVDIAEGLVIDAVAIDSVDCSFDGNGNTENSVTKRHYILSPENQALENLVPEKMSLGMEILPEDFDVDYEHPPDQTMDPSVKITKSTEIDRKTDSIHAESQIFDRKEIKKSMLVEEISAEVGKYDCDEIANTDEGCLKGDTKLKWFDTDFSDVKFAETMKMPSQEQTSMENSVATNCTEVDKESELMSKKEISTEAPNQKIDASKAMEINEVIVFKKLPSEIDNILEGAKKAEMKTSMDSVVIPKQSETSVDEVEFDVIEVPRKEILGIPPNIGRKQFVATANLTTDEQIMNKVLESELEANSPQNKIVGKLDIDEKLFSQVQTDKKVLDESHTIDIPREKFNLDEIPENITEDKKSIFGNWEGLEITKSRNHEAEDSCVETFLKSENEDDSSCLDYKILMIPRKRSEKFEELIRKFEGESEDQ